MDSVSVSPGCSEGGDPLPYVLGVTILGPSAAPGAGVTDTLPTGVAYCGGSGARWTFAEVEGTVTCAAP